ncbi:hypothetical protein EJ08DRAFT_418214 [Tothia fuscella]|uniref:Yeast cell wall synthesis Kre9/Knh1-like N-terminal domain-containing protein n=1 Tax=Tothia fuscella TaxID=1048955 RepID=A0A9P4NJB4_9PEZI|nr:hypothetical protein EJ08DRAFT_418214 [Tothia fuscella]
MWSFWWTPSISHTSSTISHLLILLLLISGAIAADEHLYFTNVPTAVTVGTKYTLTWTGWSTTNACTITLLKGSQTSSEVVYVITASATYGTYDWSPDYSLADGEDYLLHIEQDDTDGYSRSFSVSGGSAAWLSSLPTMYSSAFSIFAASSSAAPASTKSSPATVTATVTASPTRNTSPSASASATSLIDPTPTSSWDAERHEDTHLTVNDKVALGIGIPVALIALSTLGYWRAVKFFLHRKTTGQPKLPAYSAYDPARNDGSGAFSIRSSHGSRSPSLWGASSRSGSVVPDSLDTELLTAPKIVHPSPGERPGSSHSVQFNGIRASSLRQEWNAV